MTYRWLIFEMYLVREHARMFFISWFDKRDSCDMRRCIGMDSGYYKISAGWIVDHLNFLFLVWRIYIYTCTRVIKCQNTQHRWNPEWFGGWDDVDVIDTEEAGPTRKEKSSVGRGLIGRHHNCSVRDRTGSRNFLSRPTSSGTIIYFFSASENSTVSSHTIQLRLSSLLVALFDQSIEREIVSVKLN